MRFFLLDCITRLKPFAHAEGIKCISLAEDCFEHHFPGQPVYPGSLLVEGMAQLGGALMELSMRKQGETTPRCVLSKVEAKFRDFARPGDRLLLRADVVSHHAESARVRARALRDEQCLAEAEMLYVILRIDDAALEASRRQYLADLTRATRFEE